MNFGASYNLFNAEEHLIPSLLTHRKHFHYLNVVVQYESNFGELAQETLFSAVKLAKESGLVDEVIEYKVDHTLSPSINELIKRNIGLRMAKMRGIDYFTTLDADEYYEHEQLEFAIEFIKEQKPASTVASTYLHIKRPIYRSLNPDSTMVCFLSNIKYIEEIILNDFFPFNVDPTRRIGRSNQKIHVFQPHEISMKHMNLVRLDNLSSKLRNSSNAHMKDFMDNLRYSYDSWSYGEPLNFPLKGKIDIVEVPDLFNIDHIFNKEKTIFE